jgi:hypothetical protein
LSINLWCVVQNNSGAVILYEPTHPDVRPGHMRSLAHKRAGQQKRDPPESVRHDVIDPHPFQLRFKLSQSVTLGCLRSRCRRPCPPNLACPPPLRARPPIPTSRLAAFGRCRRCMLMPPRPRNNSPATEGGLLGKWAPCPAWFLRGRCRLQVTPTPVAAPSRGVRRRLLLR